MLTGTLSAAALMVGIMLTSRLDAGRALTLHGQLTSPAVAVYAPHEGQLKRVLVSPGTEVSPGMPVCVVQNTRLAADLARLREETARLESDVATRTASAAAAVKWKQQSLGHEIHDARQQLAGLLRSKLNHELAVQAWQSWLNDDGFPQRTQTATGGRDDIQLQAAAVEKISDPQLQRVQAMLALEQARNAVEVSTAQVNLCERHLKQLQE
ncbi:MAG: hypothetical protein KDA79_21355, partial [Planctomycetaceae bacterium]|nr:hypothetical protein [Planctomycetaceae bacterium]